MKGVLLSIALLASSLLASAASIIHNSAPADTSQWVIFRKVINVTGNTTNNELLIAADSKYWLWVNGGLEVFEGGLKRGPNPKDTYIDKIRLKGLKPGKNTIAVLVWHFGKQGFSHRSTDCAGLYFDLKVNGKHYGSDSSWKTKIHPAYYIPAGERPNYRLAESNVGFDASKDIPDFYKTAFDDSSWENSVEISAKDADWNNFVERPIPQWRDYGLKYLGAKEGPAVGKRVFPIGYNAQFTPYLELYAPAGLKIDIRTDDYSVEGVPSVRAEYITKQGLQFYESLGWMNGHELILDLPEGVELIRAGYRETGYNCNMNGNFTCDNKEMTNLWWKSARTLYVTMRDNYMDCPDRERAQWIGDVTNELVETFYSLSPKASLLTRKCLRELADWQKPDSVMYAPVPEGNWKKELPMQTLASVGLGSWNYYLGTGDKETIKYIFPAAKRYVHKWVIRPDGLVTYRAGAWDWGDWGSNQDMQAMCQLWYAITLDYYARQADLIGESGEANWARKTSETLKKAFHEKFWTGNGYRFDTYKGVTDDRTQALAVLAGVAPKSEWPKLIEIFKTTHFASPYMERYVLEAMCEMGYVQEAVNRMNSRYKMMNDDPNCSTLWELFIDENNPKNRGSYNHAWSSAPLIIMSKYVAGITTLTPGFNTFRVMPQLCGLHRVDANVPTANGIIRTKVRLTDTDYTLTVTVPKGSQGELCVPAGYGSYTVNGKKVDLQKVDGIDYVKYDAQPGQYEIVASK